VFDDDTDDDDDDNGTDDDDANDTEFEVTGDDIVACVVVEEAVIDVTAGLSFDAVNEDVNAKVCSRRIPSDMYCFSRIFFKQLYNTSTC